MKQRNTSIVAALAALAGLIELLRGQREVRRPGFFGEKND